MCFPPADRHRPHAGTLFSVFRPGIKLAVLRPLGPYLVAAIRAELLAERLSIDTFGPLRPDDVRLACTASRSTLGFMNQMTFEIRYHVARRGGLSGCDIDDLRRLRRTLRNRGDEYVRPIDLVAEDCAPVAPATTPDGRRARSMSRDVDSVAQERGSSRSAQPWATRSSVSAHLAFC